MDKLGIWREGKYLDVWSLNHFLFGILSAYGLTMLLNLTDWISFCIGLVAYIIWEIFEHLVKVGEYPTNQLIDVVVSIVGFWLFVLIRNTVNLIVFEHILPVLLCFIVLEGFGYYTKFKYRKRSVSGRRN